MIHFIIFTYLIVFAVEKEHWANDVYQSALFFIVWSVGVIGVIATLAGESVQLLLKLFG